MRRLLTPPLLAAALLVAAPALARDAGDNWTQGLLTDVLDTVVFGLLGLALAALGYKVLEWILPFSVAKELEEDHNISVGVVVAAMILGVCVIVAAIMLS